MASKAVLAVTSSFIDRADSLTVRHEQYVEQFVTRAHDELYTLLSEVLQVCIDVTASPEHDQIIAAYKKKLKELYKDTKSKIRIQKNTTPCKLIVRYITRSSRKTAHVYTRVLEAALKANIAASDLPAFIKKSGGVDKVGKQVSTVVQKEAQSHAIHQGRKELALALMRRPAVSTVTLGASNALPGAADVNFVHMLCRRNMATGKVEVCANLYPSSSLEELALDQYTKALHAACWLGKDGFNERCAELGLHHNLVIQWMQSNGIADAKAAENLYKQYTNAAVAVAASAGVKIVPKAPPSDAEPIVKEPEANLPKQAEAAVNECA